MKRQAASAPTTIMQMSARRGWLLVLGGVMIGLGAVIAGITGHTGVLTSLGTAGRVVAVSVGSVLVVGSFGLLASNVVQNWAVLLGFDWGLQLIYPFGLHRLMSRSRLSGRLDDARLLVAAAPQLMGTPMLAVEIVASEGSLTFSVGARGLNEDYEARFEQWLSARRDH